MSYVLFKYQIINVPSFHWFSNWKTPNASVLSVTFYLWHEKCNAGLSTDRNVDFDLVTKNEFYELDLVEMKCWCTAWVSNKTKVVHDIFWIYFHPQSFITAEIWAHITVLIIKLKLNAFVCVGLILQARMVRFWLKTAPSYMGAFRDMGITQINICTSTLYLLGFSKHETKRFIRVKGLAAI